MTVSTGVSPRALQQFLTESPWDDDAVIGRLQEYLAPRPGHPEAVWVPEDFDTATANGKLQLQMVLAFSEWWRNSIRERSIAGQAKARTEGRFPGRRPSLTGQQREYIRVERSKGVSQRELAKRLEVSRWTIQQVDG